MLFVLRISATISLYLISISDPSSRSTSTQEARNLPVQPQHLSKNQNQHHAHKDSALLHITSHTLITHDANAITSRQTRQTNRKSASEVHEPGEEGIVSRLRRRQILSYKNRYDEGVDGDDSRHNHGDQALHDEIGAEGAHACDTDAGLRGTVGGTHAAEDHGRRYSGLERGQTLVFQSWVGQQDVDRRDEGDLGRERRTMPMKGANLGVNGLSAILVSYGCVTS